MKNGKISLNPYMLNCTLGVSRYLEDDALQLKAAVGGDPRHKAGGEEEEDGEEEESSLDEADR